jgi:hypothetical protein
MNLSDFHFPECPRGSALASPGARTYPDNPDGLDPDVLAAIECCCIEAFTSRMQASTLALRGMENLKAEIERLKEAVVRFGGDVPAPEMKAMAKGLGLDCAGCGHWRSQHAFVTNRGEPFHHGACLVNRCTCVRYWWERFEVRETPERGYWYVWDNLLGRAVPPAVATQSAAEIHRTARAEWAASRSRLRCVCGHPHDFHEPFRDSGTLVYAGAGGCQARITGRNGVPVDPAEPCVCTRYTPQSQELP